MWLAKYIRAIYLLKTDMLDQTKQESEIASIVLETTALVENNQAKIALMHCNTALDLHPHSAKLHSQKGLILAKLKQFEYALTCYNHALKIDASDIETLFKRANTLKALKQYPFAISDYQQVIQLDEGHAKAWFNLGIVYQICKQTDLALKSYRQAIHFNHNYPEAHNNLGNLLKNLNYLDEAIDCYRIAIQQKPMAEAYYNQANAFKQLKRTEDALNAYQQAILLRPEYAEAYNNLAVLYLSLHRYQDAIAACQSAIKANSNYAEAYNNLGNILKQLHRDAEALNCYQQAIHLNASFAEAYNNAGLLLHIQNRSKEALQHFNRAIDLKPDYSEAYYNRSNQHRDNRDLTLALDDIKKSVALNPNDINFVSTLLYTKMQACEWSDLEEAFEQISQLILQGYAVGPFVLLATPVNANIQLKCAQNYTLKKTQASTILTNPQTQYQHQRIRLGYFSADFHNHATTYLMAELFEKHDKSKFELIAFSFGPSVEDEMRIRVKNAFDQFYDVRNYTEAQIAQLALDLEIDIAIDLKGYTKEARPSIFGYRPAPIQVNYLGYPGTMGNGNINYIIADPVLIPESARQDYTEKVAYLPNSYQVNDRHRRISDIAYSRASFGLPDNAFIFCCFNNNYKITPDVFDVWMQILTQVKNSVLWLFEANLTATHNLSNTAKKYGISSNRIIYAPKKPLAEHLARYRHADLVLDTFHYNAHTTTSDALWVGAPVLTCLGKTFAGRVAASLLTAHGVPELITNSIKSYQKSAIDLAMNPEKLAKIRNKIINNRDTHPLFDTTLYTKHLEALYIQMYKRHQNHLVPDHLVINP